MVLVGEQQALAAPARAHDDAGIGHRRRAPALGRQLRLQQAQHPAVDVVVDIGDQRLDLGRRHAVGEQPLGQLDLRRLDLCQAARLSSWVSRSMS